MPSSFVIDTTTSTSFSNRWLLLDTNALIDAYRLPSEFVDLANSFGEMGCTLITTHEIVLEFLGGTQDSSNMQKKKEFIEKLFGRTVGKVYLPIDQNAPDIETLLEFSRQASSFSIADYELYLTLKKYGVKIALVTRNHKDFSTTLTKRISFITLLGNKEIHTYGIYACA